MDGPAAVKVKSLDIAAPFRAALKETVAALAVRPKLVGFLANDDPAARQYAEWTAKAFEGDGLRYELRECAPEDLESSLHKANIDPDVHGIMIYYPVYGIGAQTFAGGSQDDYLRDSIAVEKDVEGLCHTYRSNLYRNIRFVDAEQQKKCILPCTSLSVVKILEHLKVYDATLPIGHRMHGKVVTVINRSEIVGRPLAAMLANDGATVYSVDIDSIYVFKQGRLIPADEGLTAEQCVRQAEIIVTGVRRLPPPASVHPRQLHKMRTLAEWKSRLSPHGDANKRTNSLMQSPPPSALPTFDRPRFLTERRVSRYRSSRTSCLPSGCSPARLWSTSRRSRTSPSPTCWPSRASATSRSSGRSRECTPPRPCLDPRPAQQAVSVRP